MSLEAKNIKIAYQDNIIIDEISVTIKPNEVTAIIGPNGCGKSTLLRALTNLIAPKQGDVSLDGKSLKNWPIKSLAKKIAILPQTPQAPEGLTVKQLVEHGRFAHQGLFSKADHEDAKIVQWAMQKTNIQHYQNRLFNHLSGGERQRAWVSLSLAQKAEILFLDEPTTYLDIGHQMEVMSLLQSLNQEDGLGIVMVLHDVNQALLFADRVIAMKQGAIIADGDPNEIINETLMGNLYGAKTKMIEQQIEDQQKKFCMAY